VTVSVDWTRNILDWSEDFSGECLNCAGGRQTVNNRQTAVSDKKEIVCGLLNGTFMAAIGY